MRGEESKQPVWRMELFGGLQAIGRGQVMAHLRLERGERATAEGYLRKVERIFRHKDAAPPSHALASLLRHPPS